MTENTELGFLIRSDIWWWTRSSKEEGQSWGGESYGAWGGSVMESEEREGDEGRKEKEERRKRKIRLTSVEIHGHTSWNAEESENGVVGGREIDKKVVYVITGSIVGKTEEKTPDGVGECWFSRGITTRTRKTTITTTTTCVEIAVDRRRLWHLFWRWSSINQDKNEVVNAVTPHWLCPQSSAVNLPYWLYWLYLQSPFIGRKHASLAASETTVLYDLRAGRILVTFETFLRQCLTNIAIGGRERLNGRWSSRHYEETFPTLWVISKDILFDRTRKNKT